MSRGAAGNRTAAGATGSLLPSAIAGLQGIVYVATGVWPVLHMRSFLDVTGPKTDLWLVQAFGLLVSAIGLVFLVLAIMRRVDRTAWLFGFASAAMLATIDIYFVLDGSISKVYLADGVFEATIAVLWLIVAVANHRPNQRLS